MDELWQLYSEQGTVLDGKGAKRGEVFGQGLLHGAAHVWIWRIKDGSCEILLQQRAASKQTWPNLYDISAAGHIDLGEEPLDTAVREAKEEINIEIAKDTLRLFSIFRARLRSENGLLENEFQWLYSLRLSADTHFSLQESEVASLLWVPMDQFKIECTGSQYVPHGKLYYDTVVESIEAAANAAHQDKDL